MNVISYKMEAISGVSAAAALGATKTPSEDKVAFLARIVVETASTTYSWNDIIAMIGGAVGVLVISSLILKGLYGFIKGIYKHFRGDKD